MRTIGKEKPTRDNLRAARRALELTQGQMAEKLGLSISHYKNIETGVDDPSYKVMETFEKTFSDSLIVWNIDVWRIFKKFHVEKKIHVIKDPTSIDYFTVKTDWGKNDRKDRLGL